MSISLAPELALPSRDLSTTPPPTSTHREGEADIHLPNQTSILSSTGLLTLRIHPPDVVAVEVKLEVDAGPGCGGMTWPAGRVLSEYVVRRGMQGKRVLELGSGTGLVGIAASLAGAASVIITDQAVLLPTMESNISLNALTHKVHSGELNWGDPLPSTAQNLDTILAADCVYFEPTYPLLIHTLVELCALNPGAELLFCYRQRRKADKKIFLPMLKKHFILETIEDPNREHYAKKGVSLLRLCPKTVLREAES